MKVVSRDRRTMNRLLHGATFLLLGFFSLQLAAAAEPPVTSVVFAPGGRSVVAASQAGVQIYRWPDLKRQRTINTAAANLHSLAFSTDGKRLAVGGGHPAEEGVVEIFSWPAAASLKVLSKHDDSILAVAWKDTSGLLSASLDRDIKLWNLPQSTVTHSYKGHSRGITSLCLLADGKTLVSAGDDQSLRVWDLESAQVVRSLNQHTKPIHALALRPGGEGLPMVASAAADRTVRLWQPTIGRMVRYIRLPVEPLDIAWLGNGPHLVACCVDGHVRVIDGDNVTVTQDRAAIEGWAYSLAAHPTDGSIVVGGAGGQVKRITLGEKK